MLIYEKIDDLYFVTEVIFGFEKTSIKQYGTSLDKIYHKHAEHVKNLEDGECYATGDTSMVGGGLQPREIYQHILMHNPYQPS